MLVRVKHIYSVTFLKWFCTLNSIYFNIKIFFIETLQKNKNRKCSLYCKSSIAHIKPIIKIMSHLKLSDMYKTCLIKIK